MADSTIGVVPSDSTVKPSSRTTSVGLAATVSVADGAGAVASTAVITTASIWTKNGPNQCASQSK